MTEREKQEILTKAKQFFKDKIVANHKKNTEKLSSLSAFQPNPFLEKYLAQFVFGKSDCESIAKTLIYPRVMGTSINTTFGTQMQFFCSDVLSGFASTTSGIDIEFDDQLDGRHKYCQIKAGPNTINKDDVTTIKDHFKAIKNLARTNNMRDFNVGTDCVVGIFYGKSDDPSTFYKSIAVDYPIYIGEEFWHRLTGDKAFYRELIDVISDVATEVDGTKILLKAISNLTLELEQKNN